MRAASASESSTAYRAGGRRWAAAPAAIRSRGWPSRPRIMRLLLESSTQTRILSAHRPARQPRDDRQPLQVALAGRGQRHPRMAYRNVHSAPGGRDGAELQLAHPQSFERRPSRAFHPARRLLRNRATTRADARARCSDRVGADGS